MLHEASPVEAGAEGITFLCSLLNPSWQGHRNFMDHRGSDQSKVLEKNMVRSSDCNPFSKTTLGNSLLVPTGIATLQHVQSLLCKPL